MSDIEPIQRDEGLELAKLMAEEEEGVGRRPRGYQKYVIPTIAVIWSLFQLQAEESLLLHPFRPAVWPRAPGRSRRLRAASHQNS